MTPNPTAGRSTPSHLRMKLVEGRCLGNEHTIIIIRSEYTWKQEKQLLVRQGLYASSSTVAATLRSSVAECYVFLHELFYHLFMRRSTFNIITVSLQR